MESTPKYDFCDFAQLVFFCLNFLFIVLHYLHTINMDEDSVLVIFLAVNKKPTLYPLNAANILKIIFVMQFPVIVSL